MNWIYDPAPPAPRRATVDYSDTPVQSSDTPVQSRDTHVNSRDPPVLTSDTQASAIAIRASSGAPLALPHPEKSRRRRRRRNRRSANENSAPRSATPVTPDKRWANRNSAFRRATQHQSEASDPTQMKSTPVYQEQSFHSSHLPPPTVPATNRNAAFQFDLERCRFPGLYKPGIVYPLLPRAQRPDTRVAIEASLPEAAALGRQAQPPTVVDIRDTSLPQRAPSPRRSASRRPSRKRRCNCSTGVYRLPKRSPPHGHWCE